jgi:hypothetical protein
VTAVSPLADLLVAPEAVVTVGAPTLDEALAAQGVATVPVDWRPPLAGSAEAVAAVAADARRDAANRTAVARMTAVRPLIVDVRPAAELSASAATNCCTPARRSAGTRRPVRCGARSSAPASTRAGRQRRRRPSGWRPRGRSSWRRATTTPRSGRWPAS